MLVATDRPSTFKQNRYIFHYLGLDIRSCNPSLSVKDATYLIKQMKDDPKFVYDYLIENKAKVVDSSKLEKALSKEKSVKTIKPKSKKTKTQLCIDLYRKNKNLTNMEIARQVGCHNSVVARAIKSVKTTKKHFSGPSIKSVSHHISKNLCNISFDVEQLTSSYNSYYGSDFTINQFNNELKKMVKKGSLIKTGKLYSAHTNGDKKIVSACADSFILKRIRSKKLKFSLNDLVKEYPDVDSGKIKKAVQNWSYSNKTVHNHLIKSQGKGKYVLVGDKDSLPEIKTSVEDTSNALEIANSLYKMVGMQNAIKFLKLIESLKNG